MINNELFKLKEIPNYHPIVDKYERTDFWREEKRKCIEGYWVGGYWMPPELYYYVNFHHITMEEGIYRGIHLPWHRDIEWEKARLYAEATGFSGFEMDERYSCNRLLLEDLTDDELLIFCRDSSSNINLLYRGNFFKPDGTRKEYIPTKDYIGRNHGISLGRPIYLNPAKHIMEMAARGLGKSYWASACIAHNFLFSGARNYDEYLRLKKMDNPLKTETVVGAVDTKYSYKLVDKVLTALTRLPGSFNMMLERDNVVFPSPLSVATEGSMAVGKTFKAITSGSIIQHVTFADNPLAANGGRPNKIFIDEVGFQKNILETWEAIESTQAAEVFKRLTIYAMGTGGLTSAGAVTYTQEIFTNPDTYNCIAIDDVWENSGKIGYFVSAIKASNKYKEGPNYITNEDKGLIDIEKEREKARKSKSKTKLLGLMINKPIKPSEIFLRLDGTFFRAEDLKRVLGELETNRKLLDLSWKVDLEFIKEGIVYPMPSNKRPIRDFPLRRGMDMEGCVELFEKPKKDSAGLIPFRRYIIATDPVDDDENTNIRLSLQSTFVLDTWTDRIVAEYTSRTYFVDDYYENVRRLCMYYNTQCLYENNKKGMYSYFKNKGSLHLLAETPDIMKQQNVVRAEGISNKAVGVNISNEQVKLYAIQRYKKWLETLANTNSEEDEGKQNYQLIRSVGLLKETINYTLDGNYDRVSAMMILMIYRDELALQVQAVKASGNNAENSMTDKFWSRAYKKYVHKPNEVYNRTRKNRYLSLN